MYSETYFSKNIFWQFFCIFWNVFENISFCCMGTAHDSVQKALIKWINGSLIMLDFKLQTKQSCDLQNTRWGCKAALSVPAALRSLTWEELLRVHQLAGLLFLQLVGFVCVRGQRALPVHAALAQALGVKPVRSQPQQHAALQHVRQLLGPAPLRLRVGEGEEHGLGPAVQTLLGARGRRGRGRSWRRRGGDPTAFRAAGGHLLHQRLTVIQRDVQATVCGPQEIDINLHLPSRVKITRTPKIKLFFGPECLFWSIFIIFSP